MASDQVKRKLAAILAADIAGYSRLMGADEAGTLARLKEYRRELIDPKNKKYRGRVVKTTGDGILIEFPSVVDAVSCSIEVQQGMRERNADVPTEERIEFRIGINLGDVIIEGRDLYGDGVNIAARLEGLAEPGGICISQTVLNHARGKIALEVDDLGERALKNIAKPIHVYRVLLNSSWEHLTCRSPDPALALPDKPSIAVLPFQNMSGDPEQEYFTDGMVEEIITGLSRMHWLFVIARNSSFAYKGKSPDIRQVGRELGVRYVLEGSVRKAANRLRITGQLIDAATGAHLWADRFDGGIEDVFELQDHVTSRVIGAIAPKLEQAEIERVKRKRPENLGAYDLVLRALPHVYTSMPDGAAKALGHLDRALEMEPDYALAHGLAAWAHEIVFARGGGRDESRLGAVRHAHAAIANGRDDAIALTLGGFVMGLVAHDRDAARQALEAALALSPSCALAYILGSVVMEYAGEADRGVEWGESAIRLSPFDPMNYAAWFSIALGRLARGEYEMAAEAAQKTFQANPYWSYAHFMLAATHARLGRLDAAKSASARVLELQPSFTISGTCASFDIHPAVAVPLSEALIAAGLPA
jgi:adenylate cyclase